MKKNSNKESLTPDQEKVKTLLDSVKGIQDLDKQIATAEKALKLAEDIKWQVGVSRAYKIIGIRYQQSSALDRAIPYFLKALEISKMIGDKKQELSARDELSITYLIQGNPSKALELQFENLEIIKNDGRLSSELALALVNIGTAFDSLGVFDMAIEYTQESLKVERELGGNECIALMNLGIDYLNIKKYSVALDFFSQALEIAKRLDSRGDIAKAYSDLCNVYTKLELYEQAEVAGKESFVFAKATNNLEDQCLALIHLGEAHEGQRKIQEAIDLYSRAIETSLPAGESIFLFEAKYALGCALIKSGDFTAAENILSECLLFTSKNGFKMHESDCHKKLSELYSKKGGINQELDHLKKHYELQAAIYDEKSANRLIAYQIQHQIEKRENENMLLKFKSEELEKQLSNKALQLVRQTDMLLTLRHDLDGIVRHADTAEKAVRSIREKLKAIPEHLLNWEKFSEDFRKVHPDFENIIKKKYPSLSKAEVKVCCLLRIGMSTREISTLLFLTERTVESHRLSIRKKLGIKKGLEMHEVLAAT